IQKKVQAEAGPVPGRDAQGAGILGANGQPQMSAAAVAPRWGGSGWTGFNNKGKAGRRYEPFFTDPLGVWGGAGNGVGAGFCCDPAERLIATLHPNHTWEKVAFDPWQRAEWDTNDTLLVTDPRNDPDIGDAFSRLPSSDYLPSWYGLRTDPLLAPAAAQR